MDRQEFLLILWRKLFKPALILIVIIYCGLFLYSAITEKGGARLGLILLTAITLLSVIGALFGYWIDNELPVFWKKLPAPIRKGLTFFGKILNYASVVFFVLTMIQLWRNDWITGAVALAGFTIHRIIHLINSKKGNQG